MISVLMPYYDRAKQLEATLESYEAYYRDVDYEVILVEDRKNLLDDHMHDDLLDTLHRHNKIHNNLVVNTSYKGYAPGAHYNLAAKLARGDTLVLTNPEIRHTCKILPYLEGKDVYEVCACLALNADGSVEQWYQHSAYNPRCLHFCSAISADTYAKVGGFDTDFFEGWGYDDNSFVEQVRRAGIPILQRDDLLTHHLHHDRSYNMDPDTLNALLEKNREKYVSKWG